MAKTKRKIALALVEGPSDKTALEMALSNALASLGCNVEVRCLFGDITSANGVKPDNVVKRVTAEVQNYARKNGNLRSSDFQCVIQITDTDGAYIPPASVVNSKTVAPDPFYTPTQIQTANRDDILDRNARKSANINKLISVNAIWRKAIPYSIYYMSCNMENAFHGMNNLSDKDKKAFANQFRLCYGNDVPAFLAFLQSLSPPQPYQNYKMSWDYIKLRLHSLQPYSNLYTLLQFPPLTSTPPNAGNNSAPSV